MHFSIKTIFNPDLTKPAQKVIFCRKTKKLLHPCLSFNDTPLKNSISQKHFGLTLDVKLNFLEHIKNITQKIGKATGLLCRFQPILPRLSQLTIYKRFIRSHLDFPDVIYNQACKYSFWKTRIYSIQCLPGNNRSNKTNIIRKSLLRVRVTISKIETLV